ncbi:uncharacterized protein [Euphorbia lathyris]|uniref:uncharacterized protein isoform X2 n=1 Tax=Euphorbia lathyris TaxID=212925 RepID=UPI0033143B61
MVVKVDAETSMKRKSFGVRPKFIFKFWYFTKISVMLRAIIHQAIIDKDIPLPVGQNIERNGVTKRNKMTSSLLNWKEPPHSSNESKNVMYGDLSNLEDPFTFLSALERVEAWIFSRTVESIWWQTLTPHMQSDATKEIDRLLSSGSKKSLKRSSSSVDQDQVNSSLELWKNAFKDACERLCPVRAGGHDCGCLPELARLNAVENDNYAVGAQVWDKISKQG